MNVIVKEMARTTADGFLTFEEWLAEDLEDPAFREAWFETVLARSVSVAIIRYRGEHGLTQTALAERLGMSQTQVSRLEIGEHTPTFETLLRVCDALGIELTLTIGPKQELQRPLPKRRRGEHVDATDQVVIGVREAPAARR